MPLTSSFPDVSAYLSQRLQYRVTALPQELLLIPGQNNLELRFI